MKKVFGYLTVLFFVVGAFVVIPGSNNALGSDRPSAEAEAPPATMSSNLLVNGNMEELSFYWKYPNHYVAGGWLRWWLGDDIPEYDDVRSWRPWKYDGQHAQTYFRWAQPYTAGIYQRVTGIQPCTYYRFDMYGRNHSNDGANHYARLGIDPLGRTYNDIDHPSISGFPSGISWSAYKTYFKVWGLHRLTTESRSNALTAITYASPQPGYGYYDTFWDAGSLYQVSPPGGRLDEPDDWTPSGFIHSVVSYTVSSQLYIEWETTSAASTQVWYDMSNLSTVTVTVPTSYTMYFPLIFRTSTWRYNSVADQTPVTQHQVIIDDVEGKLIEFVLLSRWLDGTVCRTEVSEVFRLEIPSSSAVLLDEE